MISEIYLINMGYSVINICFITMIVVYHGKSLAINECRNLNIAKKGKCIDRKLTENWTKTNAFIKFKFKTAVR